MLIIVSIINVASGCGPGRGAGRRRGVHKLTPLVFKQHVPNVSENTLGASGLTEGPITRDDPRFGDLIPNYNSDIIFKDEEGTGADRFMTQRCKEKLNTLAISVMNQWPGVKLRVTEGWDEEGHHAADSLHYEGRAVDVTTSDRDRSKYGMLAKLAVEAGFDWVYYESRAHIHCSVKSESSQAVKTGGCFPGGAKVRTKTGVKKSLSSLEIGDEIQVVDSETGDLKFSEVLLFLDKKPENVKHYLNIETKSGKKLQVTPSHLIVAIKNAGYQHDNNNLITERTGKNFETFFASEIEIGDALLTVGRDGDEKLTDEVVNVTNVRHEGVYAPLTVEGTIVVNDVVTSCYAVIKSHNLAHLVYGPLRLYHNFQLSFKRLWENTLKPKTIKGGIHWYANVLFTVAEYVLPSSMMYGS
ncbi:hypothetical protein, conserved [Pediculus humanus corporis]|uniref:Hedgehog protein n=1 Tax=Pediculus humanus subsp. corporis TaxID=121224 RepID=E0V9Q6_PEDHC|nr:uncharacterized protein Phum_PHUM018090 [Pediculus humanus corporis]EEB10091.1 hypothetical protein, conserved [Pediculus humanus corporis]